MNRSQRYLFIECEGESGRSAKSMTHLKYQHAQLRKSSRRENVQHGSAPLLPMPFQIRFRYPDQANAERSSCRCSHCGSIRKLATRSRRCGSCDKTASLQPEGVVVNQGAGGYDDSNDDPQGLSQISTPLGSVIRNLSRGTKGSQTDRKAMDYFLNYAALDLSGYLPGNFWDCLVLQGSQSNPMVCQAVLAVSGAHLDRCNVGQMSTASLASYQASIRKLRDYMLHAGHPSPELVLLCCILLFTFDRLRGDDAAAMIHLRSAMAILAQSRKSLMNQSTENQTAAVSPDALTQLTNILIRLDIENTMPVLDRGPLLDPEFVSPHFWTQRPQAMKFFTPHDFMEPWMLVCHAVWTLIGRNARYRHVPVGQIPPSVLQHRSHLQQRIKAWRAAYKDYIRRTGIPDACDIHQGVLSPALKRRILDAINALIIESHYFVIKSVLAECLPCPHNTDTRPWDLVAEKMLLCAEKALSLRLAHRRINNTATQRTFSTHVGIAESLMCLSHRTTSPDVRSRAQQLIEGFRDVSGELTGVSAFFAGNGAPPEDLVLMYERPGH